MLSLIKIELNKVSKSKLFLAWLCTIFIVLGITAIIIMGLGTDNKLGEFTGQDSNVIRITGKWEGWAIVASLFSSLFTKVAFLIFESYLLSTIIIDEFKRRTIFCLPNRKIIALNSIKLGFPIYSESLFFCFDTHGDTHILKANVGSKFVSNFIFCFLGDVSIYVHSCLYIFMS